jgi:phosphoribosylglycinamide formyltransferase-1
VHGDGRGLRTGSKRFAILASGRGSNAVALMEAFDSGFIPAILAAVLSNKADAPVLERARERGVAAEAVPGAGLTREAHEAALLTALASHGVEHLLLAGYMRVLSPYFLSRWRGAVLNIHPALLPDFPGLHAAQRQWEAGRKVAGATVHFVDAGVDTGPTLLQGSLVVRGDEGPAGLAERILLEVEHQIYPRAVRLFLDRMATHD